MDLQHKLAILADAAKYDASCASSGSQPRDSVGGRGIGSAEGMGICQQLRARRPLHLAAQGPADQLLPVRLPLLREPRLEQRAARAASAPAEVVHLTLDFYRRNCIEGLFLSERHRRGGRLHHGAGGGGRALSLREARDFRGYIHLARPFPMRQRRAARSAPAAMPTGLCINIELPPTARPAGAGARRRTGAAIRRSMARLRLQIEEHARGQAQDDARRRSRAAGRGARSRDSRRRASRPRARARR